MAFHNTDDAFRTSGRKGGAPLFAGGKRDESRRVGRAAEATEEATVEATMEASGSGGASAGSNGCPPVGCQQVRSAYCLAWGLIHVRMSLSLTAAEMRPKVPCRVALEVCVRRSRSSKAER